MVDVRRPILASTFALLASAGGCSKTEVAKGLPGVASATAPADAGAGDGPILIGASLGLSGSQAGVASSVKDAILLAEAQINEAGGVLRRPVRFLVQDDRTDKGTFLIDGIEHFLDQNVSAVLGPLGSGQVKASHGAVRARSTVQMSPWSTSPDLSGNAMNPEFDGADRYFFRTVPPDDFQGKVVAGFALKGPSGGAPCRKMAILAFDDAYATAIVPVITSNFTRGGGAVVFSKTDIPFSSDAFVDPGSVARAVVASGATCQTIVMYAPHASLYLRAFKALAAPPGFFTVGTDAIYSDGFLEQSRTTPANPRSENYLTGLFGSNVDTTPDTVEFHEFESLHRSYYPGNAGGVPAYASNAYDAAVLLALAIEGAKSASDGPAIRDALWSVSRGRTSTPAKMSPARLGDALATLRRGADINYQGASGAVDLDERGNVEAGYVIWHVEQTEGAEPAFVTKERISVDDLR